MDCDLPAGEGCGSQALGLYPVRVLHGYKRAYHADAAHLLAMLEEVAREHDLVAKAEARSAKVDIWLKLREHGKRADRLLIFVAG